jgi:hypothetical protein
MPIVPPALGAANSEIFTAKNTSDRSQDHRKTTPTRKLFTRQTMPSIPIWGDDGIGRLASN